MYQCSKFLPISGILGDREYSTVQLYIVRGVMKCDVMTNDADEKSDTLVECEII